MSCRIDREQHRQLKILAARRDGTIQDVLRDAISDYLTEQQKDCPCMWGGGCNCSD